jgi:hypothetical protein
MEPLVKSTCARLSHMLAESDPKETSDTSLGLDEGSGGRVQCPKQRVLCALSTNDFRIALAGAALEGQKLEQTHDCQGGNMDCAVPVEPCCDGLRALVSCVLTALVLSALRNRNVNKSEVRLSRCGDFSPGYLPRLFCSYAARNGGGQPPRQHQRHEGLR